MTRSGTDTLGSLVQAYADVQYTAVLGARASLQARDEDAVHPTRVAIRRLRATLRTFGTVYQRIDRESLIKELTWAGMLLGDVRDLQVLAERFDEDATTGAPARQALEEAIADDRALAWEAATQGLSSARGAALFAQVARWQEEPPLRGKAGIPAARARRLVEKADERLQRRLQRARRAADAGDPGAGDLLHDARKAGKRSRYAVELARPVLGEDAERIIEAREELQDALGAHQDAVVALAYLQSVAAGSESSRAARGIRALIARTRTSADDVVGALRRADAID